MQNFTKFDRNTIADGDKLNLNIETALANDQSTLDIQNNTSSTYDDVYATVYANSAVNWDNNKIIGFKQINTLNDNKSIVGKPYFADVLNVSADNRYFTVGYYFDGSITFNYKRSYFNNLPSYYKICKKFNTHATMTDGTIVFSTSRLSSGGFSGDVSDSILFLNQGNDNNISYNFSATNSAIYFNNACKHLIKSTNNSIVYNGFGNSDNSMHKTCENKSLCINPCTMPCFVSNSAIAIKGGHDVSNKSIYISEMNHTDGDGVTHEVYVQNGSVDIFATNNRNLGTPLYVQDYSIAAYTMMAVTRNMGQCYVSGNSISLGVLPKSVKNCSISLCQGYDSNTSYYGPANSAIAIHYHSNSKPMGSCSNRSIAFGQSLGTYTSMYYDIDNTTYGDSISLMCPINAFSKKSIYLKGTCYNNHTFSQYDETYGNTSAIIHNVTGNMQSVSASLLSTFDYVNYNNRHTTLNSMLLNSTGSNSLQSYTDSIILNSNKLKGPVSANIINLSTFDSNIIQTMNNNIISDFVGNLTNVNQSFITNFRAKIMGVENSIISNSTSNASTQTNSTISNSFLHKAQEMLAQTTTNSTDNIIICSKRVEQDSGLVNPVSSLILESDYYGAFAKSLLFQHHAPSDVTYTRYYSPDNAAIRMCNTAEYLVERADIVDKCMLCCNTKKYDLSEESEFDEYNSVLAKKLYGYRQCSKHYNFMFMFDGGFTLDEYGFVNDIAFESSNYNTVKNVDNYMIYSHAGVTAFNTLLKNRYININNNRLFTIM